MEPKNLTLKILADGVALSVPHLLRLAADVDGMYSPTRLARMSEKKSRELDVPLYRHKKFFKRLHKFLSNNFAFSSAAHGGMRGRSCFTSADQHCGATLVETIDITDCFPSVHAEPLRLSLIQLGFPKRVSRLLSRFLTCLDRIPQGSPISNVALNLHLWSIDSLVLNFCQPRGVHFTRCADDFVFSGEPAPVAEAGAFIEATIRSCGLSINEKKRAKNANKIRPKQQLVHSIEVNDRRGTRIQPNKTAQFLDLAEKYLRAARCVAPHSLEGVAKLRQRAVGCAHYSNQAKFSSSRKLLQIIARADKLVQQKLEDAKVTRTKKWWVLNPRNRVVGFAKSWADRLLAPESSVVAPF